ncbi:hypothetical protein Cs7R123_48620 [Catellatospora sp. TT07R-123]|uniref:phosphopantetheine-binding protein n=1 Tax=Catellatospora sp. TT07R-123 TaxID=2733863 RepID=UPI001B0B681A|nr:phosphopantetheine-binding protein [Catellatospora sp. TT07R-123]GHJ47520.1 hypothetical protein Cs7R123_48620 [Catellatospora sp. TT07R-123]
MTDLAPLGVRGSELTTHRTRLGRDLLVLRYAAEPGEVDPLALRHAHAGLDRAHRPDRYTRVDGLDDPAVLGDPRPPLATAYRQPDGGTEAVVADVWAEVLGLEEVGADDDFFELGGDSLAVVETVAALTVLYGPTWRGDLPLELALLGVYRPALVAAVLAPAEPGTGAGA